MDLMEWLANAKHSLFRFETLQEYDVGEELAEAEEFFRTGKMDLSQMQK